MKANVRRISLGIIFLILPLLQAATTSRTSSERYLVLQELAVRFEAASFVNQEYAVFIPQKAEFFLGKKEAYEWAASLLREEMENPGLWSGITQSPP